MMKPARTAFARGLAFAMSVLSTGALAQQSNSPIDQWDCTGIQFEAVGSVDGLPSEVRRLLVKNSPVADRGQPFQETDVIVVPHLPGRRLELAAVSDRKIVAAVERGGLPTELWWFERGDKGWTGLAAGRAPPRWADYAPESLDFLLYLACRGYPRPDPPADRAVSVIVTGKGNMVLTLRTAQASVAYELFRNPALRGTTKYEEIKYLATKRGLSREERVGLRSKLDKILSALAESNPNRQMVATFVNALTAPTGRYP